MDEYDERAVHHPFFMSSASETAVDTRRTKCDQQIKSERVIRNYEKVTCRRCLGHRIEKVNDS